MSAPTTVSPPLVDGETDDEHRARQINVLMQHARHMAAQVAELTQAQTAVLREVRQVSASLNEHIKSSAKWREQTDVAIKANTEITQGIAQAKTAFTFGRKAVIWLGTLAAGIVGLWQLWAAIRKGTPDIGP